MIRPRALPFTLLLLSAAACDSSDGDADANQAATEADDDTADDDAADDDATDDDATDDDGDDVTADDAVDDAPSDDLTDDVTDDAPSDAGSEPAPVDASTQEPGTLPYANVTAVTTSGADGSFTFSVSVESADIDCSQYADYWEVLGEDGSLLYRRILEHSHTDENGTSDADAPGNTFTRSGGPVPIAAEEIVIVRAHMSTSGYVGVAFRGSVSEGFVEAPDIDASFAAEVTNEEPLPGECLF